MRRALVLLLLTLPAAAREATAPPSADKPVLAYLNQAIGWYRQQLAQVPLSDEPSDLAALDQERRIGREVIGLAFAFARASLALQPQGPASPAASAGAGNGLDGPALARLTADAESRLQELQGEIDTLLRQLAAAQPASRAGLQQRLAETRSELQLAQAQRDTVRTFSEFLGRGALRGADLAGQIDELQRSIPEAAAASQPAPPPAPAAAARKSPTGVLALSSSLIAIAHKRRAVAEAIALTAQLRGAVDKLQAPLLAEMRRTLAQGDALAQAADTATGAALDQRRSDIERLTARFKQVSAAVIPLGKQAVLLDTGKANLADWHAAVDGQYAADLRALLLHLALLAVAIAAILAASEFWRRATFRYVRDLRRRQQSLVLRRVVVALLVTLMVVFSLVTELGSIATFAGFITAGLAVALQNVILSVAAYFFLIGKYGIRVGDRVQISGATGDVMDIGLVRLHLMELRADGLPTGRVVVFSNAVLFQPSANFFKQIPGSNFSWHQVTLTLAAQTDYRAAEQRLMAAVEEVYAEYRAELAQQHQEMSASLSIPVRELRPGAQLRFTDAGLEMTIRFPVPLQHAPTIDDRMTRALLNALATEPRLRLVGSGVPSAEPAGLHG